MVGTAPSPVPTHTTCIGGMSPGDQDPTPIATGIVANAYVDTLIDDGVSYYYTVTAVTTGGERAFSSEVQVDSLTNLVIPGTAGDDLIYVITTADKLDIYINIPPVGEPSYRLPLANLRDGNVQHACGNDSLTVDAAYGQGFGQLTYNAGSGANTLTLRGGSARIESTSAGGTLDTTVANGAALDAATGTKRFDVGG